MFVLAFLSCTRSGPALEVAQELPAVPSEVPIAVEEAPPPEPEPPPPPPLSPGTLTVESYRDGVAVTVILPDGTEQSGTTPFRVESGGGEAVVQLSAPGKETREDRVSIDGDTLHRVCMSDEGQLLECVWRLRCGLRPKAVLFSPDGSELWLAALYDKPALEIYDTTTWEEIGSVELGDYGAVELHFSEDGSKLYASQLETNLVYEVDVATRTVLRQFPTLGTFPKIIEISPDGHTLWSSNWKTRNLVRVDLDSGESTAVPSVRTPRGMYATADGRYLFVAGYGGGELQRIDRQTGESEILFTNGGALRHIVADESSNTLFISDMRGSVLWTWPIDGQPGDEPTLLARLDPNTNTIDISPDGQVIFVSNRGRNNPETYMKAGPEWGSVLVIDARSGELLDAIVAGNQPTGLDLSADGTLLAHSDFRDNRLNIYRVPSTEELRAGEGGRATVYKADLRKAGWVSHEEEGKTNPDILGISP